MKLKNLLFVLLTSLAVSVTIVACSSEEKPASTPATASKPDKPAFDPFDHSKDKKVSAADKEKFEKAFAEQCVTREMTTAPNADKEKIEQSCTCVATFLMKDLTAKEAEKFMVEHENPVSLTFKFENAAYHCVQEKAHAQDSGFDHPAIHENQ